VSTIRKGSSNGRTLFRGIHIKAKKNEKSLLEEKIQVLRRRAGGPGEEVRSKLEGFP